MRLALIVIAGTLALGGEAGAQDATYTDSYIQQLQDQTDTKRCIEDKMPPGSERYGWCRLQLAQIRANEEAQAAEVRAAAAQAAEADRARHDAIIQQYLQMWQNNYNQQMANIRAGMQAYGPRPSMNCSTNYIGNQAYTNCN